MNRKSPLLTLVQESTSIKRKRGTLYTPEEILNQCCIWNNTAEYIVSKHSYLRNILNKKSNNLILTGTGSSYYVCKALEWTLRNHINGRVITAPATDIVTHSNHLFPSDIDGLMVHFSRSGNTPESVHTVNVMRRDYPRLFHIVVTCNQNSAIVKQFSKKHNVLILPLSKQTCDMGLAMTTSVSNMFIAGAFFNFINNPGRYISSVHQLSQAGIKILDKYAGLAKQLGLKKFRRVILLGTGRLHTAAMEGALKITELTDGEIATMAETFLGVRHGPITFVDERTLVIYLISPDSKVQNYEMDLIRQLHKKGLGMCRVALTSSSNKAISRYADYVVNLGSYNYEMAFPIYLLFLQMYGLFSSLAHGLKPDNPSRRNVITRVVKGVKIY